MNTICAATSNGLNTVMYCFIADSVHICVINLAPKLSLGKYFKYQVAMPVGKRFILKTFAGKFY